MSKSSYKVGHTPETALLSTKNEVHLALATSVVLLEQSAVFHTTDIMTRP